MNDCATSTTRFETFPLELEAAFDGGRITSDGGLCWLAKADRELRVCEAIAEHVPEWRNGSSVRHSLKALVRQRLYQIACGYEDQDDSDTLRSDPLLKLVLGRLPETEPDLASQPTISRLENAPAGGDYLRMARALGELYIPVGAPKTACHRASCWTSTQRTIPPTAIRRGPITMATTGPACTIPCSSSTERPISSSRRCFVRAIPTPVTAHMLSDEAKRLELGELYSKAKSTYDQLTDEYRSSIHERLRKTRKAAFAVPKIAGADKAMELLAYRSALDSVAKTKDTRELSELLARAEITGDPPLARAVLYRGYELQNEGLVGAYLESYPEELPAWGTFMEAAEAHNSLETLGISGATGVPEPERPQELAAQSLQEQSWRQFAYSTASNEGSGESSAGGAEE